METNKTVLENIQDAYESLFSAEKKVADCILKNPQEAIMMNVSELATASDVSDATVIRMCKHIGYQGYYQMRLILSRDMGKKEVEPDMKSPIDSIQRLFERLAHNVNIIAENIDINTMMKCVEILKASQTVFVVASGNMTPLALDLGYRLERFGIKTSYSTVPEYFLSHVSLGTAEDALIVMSKSGTSKQIVQATDVAKKLGMKVLAITGTAKSPITREADYVLLSACGQEIFEGNEPDDHLYEMAVCDALLYFVRHGEAICKHISDSAEDQHNEAMELLLSEYKL